MGRTDCGKQDIRKLVSGRSNRRCIDFARKLDAYGLLIKPFGNNNIDASSFEIFDGLPRLSMFCL